MKTATLHPVPRWCRALVASLIGWVVLPGAGLADPTQISNAPLFTSAALTVYPNIMFVMDNSGSMASTYLPESTSGYADPEKGNYVGAVSAHCNGLAYDPTTAYALPVDSKGVPLAAPSTDDLAPTFSRGSSSLTSDVDIVMPAVASTPSVVLKNADGDEYAKGDFISVYTSGTSFFAGTVTAVSYSRSTDKLTVTIAVSIVNGTVGSTMKGAKAVKGIAPYFVYYKYKGLLPDLGLTYNKGAVVTNSTFYQECKTSPSSTTKFDALLVWPSSPEAQNYANWMSFYSTRMKLMTSSMKLAFKNVTDKYRVGYTTINNIGDTKCIGTVSRSGCSGTLVPMNFLDIADFGEAQKDLFYGKLDFATPGGGTPLRGALSRAGQYFANMAPGQKSDPVQFACQRNFTILSTDGYWNVTGVESTGYGPYKLNNTDTVDQQDGSPTKAPMSDGNAATQKSNTLADIAMYYYKTDLRTATLKNCTGAKDANGVTHDVCEDKVPGSEGDSYHSFGDTAKWQHMTTFTIGLGVAGILDYDPNYLTARSGDFDKIVNGELNWPAPDTNACGSCAPPANADDLWHAAVNGRGQYFSATEPGSLARGLNAALNSIKAATGSAAAASTSSLQPVAGDNDIFVAQFTTMKWVGDVLAFKIDPDTGNIGTTASWSAQAELDKKDPTARTIYYSDGAKTPAMKLFTYANLKADGFNNKLDNFCSLPGADPKMGTPDQCATLGTDELKVANDGSKLVDYLRGDQSLSASFRSRVNRLGDIINASPLFIGKPSFKYGDTGYDTFKTTKATRTAVVLAAANDGMLHAFNRSTGNEEWAFVPSFVIPNLYKLADTNYANNHQFYVDGSPTMGDINVGGTWKTIVVGGLNSGGRGYYALDVTNPVAPTLLWEFTDPNLGLTYGNPIITKRAGKWVVVFASGYNNAPVGGVGTGDGNGHLFVLDANTGTLLEDIPTYSSGTTAVGSAATPSGLARINVWVDDETDNTELRFYGGDLLGNLWRFRIDGSPATDKGALLLAQFKAPATVGQSITTKPMLAEVTYNGAKYPVVYVGTGRYLGSDDLKDTTVQAMYAIKDPLTSTGWGVIRDRADLEVRTITAGTDASKNPTRTISSGTVDWSSKVGWTANFPGSGERVSVNPAQALDKLYVGTNVPSSDSCEAGGSSFLYQFDINTGNGSASYVDQVLVQGLTIIQLAQGASAGAIEIILTRSDGRVEGKPGAPPPASNNLKRTSWRELVD
jgi:type IV pilus assembly protein PilY1